MVWVLGKAIARRYKELTVRKFFISTEIAAQKKARLFAWLINYSSCDCKGLESQEEEYNSHNVRVIDTISARYDCSSKSECHSSKRYHIHRIDEECFNRFHKMKVNNKIPTSIKRQDILLPNGRESINTDDLVAMSHRFTSRLSRCRFARLHFVNRLSTRCWYRCRSNDTHRYVGLRIP